MKQIILLTVLCIGVPLSIAAQSQQHGDEKVYIRIEILGMACPFCAFGMENDLKKIAGVTNVEIELTEGLAFISTPLSQKPTKDALKKIVIDGGFSVGKIEFSDKAFVRKTPRQKSSEK